MLKSDFETTLKPRDIILRLDDATDETAENNICMYYPAVRISELVLGSSEITFFRLSVGETFLPKLTVLFSDDDGLFSESRFIHGDDLCTIRISNNLDTVYEPIKIDFSIREFSNNGGGMFVDGSADVPKLREYHNEVHNLSSYEICKKVAQRCGLGFVSNVTGSNDTMKWVQSGRDIDFILDDVIPYSHIGLDDSLICYIDQYMNLYYLSMQKAFSDPSKYVIETDPISGERMKAETIILTNGMFNDRPCQIENWSPNTQFGSMGLNTPKTLVVYTNDATLEQVSGSVTDKKVVSEKSLGGESYTYNHAPDTHPNYESSPAINSRNKSIISQSTNITANMRYYIPAISAGMRLSVELYNTLRREETEDQEQTDSAASVENKSQYAPLQYTLNEEHSGLYFVSSMSYTFSRDDLRINQTLNLTKTNE